ncbi:MAG: lamin tail domain-containing protein [Anaerolineaceae bacterium]
MILNTNWLEMRKLLPYLILNFFISAAAVLLVLVIWENTHRVSATELAGSAQMAADTLPTSDATLPPADAITIEIQAVIGAGDLENEHIQLACKSKDPVDLLGWRLIFENHYDYVFPKVTLFPGGSVNVYSKAGVDSAIELFFQQPVSILVSGEEIQLRDPAGTIRSRYTIP